jgi:hypothetical protein
MKDVEHIFGDVAAKTELLQIEDITVSLTIGKSGEISLVSITKGAASAGTCITVRLRRKA